MRVQIRSTFAQRAAASAAAACAAGALSAASAPADAQVISRFHINGEGGLGTMLSADQRTTLGYDLAIQGSGRLGFTLFEPLAIQLAFSSWYFTSDAGAGQATLLGGGLRFEPMLGRVGRLVVDAHAHLALTGYQLPSVYTRFGFDVGLGFEFALTRWLGLGPMLRYAHVVTTDQDFRSDAMFWSAGLSATLRVPPAANRPAPVAPADSDGDTVVDSEDLCPTVPMGAHPDPVRRGCPVGDRDHDTVLDNVDACPDEPQGAHPDPARRGCPEGDRDHDTVLDSADRCPDEPQGAHPDPERAGCPDGDDDHDGVLNHEDQCRTEHAGPRPDPARPGCPIPDRDHDTVPDAVDHCPDQPGAPNPDPNLNGCPGLVRVTEGAIQILSPVFFATNRDTILRQSFPVLTAVANALRASPQIRRISVEGHTDDQGDDARNLALSERRAASVQTFLIAHGVDAGRIEAHGFGETRPTQPVTGLTGRALRDARASNRRVEFRIVDPAPTTSGSSATPAPDGTMPPSPAGPPSAPASPQP